MRNTCIVLVAALMAACSDDGGTPWIMDGWDVPGDGEGDAALDGDVPADVPVEAPDGVDHTGDTDCHQDIDIVFVLDVSTSMSWVLEQLASEVGAVWEYAVALSAHPDFDPAFGLVVFVDDVLVTNGGEPYASVEALQGEFNSWRAFCSSNAQPGGSSCTNMDCPENTLDALADAAEMYAWRPGALHVAIHVTDDTFKEAPDMLCSTFSPSIPVRHTYPETLDLLVTNEIRVGVFAMRVGSYCTTPPDKEPGFFEPWEGYPPIPEATGSRVWELSAVQSGEISLTEAISGFVLEEWCTDFI
jgi:hypothetical protein